MQTPLEISFRNMDVSPAVETRVRERAQRLERFYSGITSCHVFIKAPHESHQSGNLYEVHIEVRVPGSELLVTGKPGNADAHADIMVAVRDAFDVMERRLKKWKQQRA
jgi:ribosomal subunit interface protein